MLRGTRRPRASRRARGRGASDAGAEPDGAGEPEAAGEPDAPGDAGVRKASFQQAGNGVEPGAGLQLGSTQPLNVSSWPVLGLTTGSYSPGSSIGVRSLLGAG